MSDLNEHFERLKWARSEIERLDIEATKYTDSEPIEVYTVTSFSRGFPTRLYRTRLRHEVPSAIPIHSGAIINELRATLDALSVTLASRNGHPNSTKTYFPTAKSESGFEEPEVQRKVRHLSEDDRLTIKSLQPWRGGNDMLYALHSTDLIRKHQRLIVLSGGTEGTELGRKGGWTLDGGRLFFINTGPGHPPGKPIAETHLDYQLPIKQIAMVAFSEPDAIESKPLIATLHDFASLVESILKLFRQK